MSSFLYFTSVPSTAGAGTTAEVKGASSCGASTTTFEVTANGSAVGFTVTWNGDAFTMQIDVPPCSEEGDNIVTVRAKCGGLDADDSFLISPC